MAYYIEKNGTPIDNQTFESIAAALNFARLPAYAGASPTEITLVGDTSYSMRGITYQINTGDNPKQARRDARAQLNVKAPTNLTGQYRGTNWLSREMDRADSDF